MCLPGRIVSDMLYCCDEDIKDLNIFTNPMQDDEVASSVFSVLKMVPECIKRFCGTYNFSFQNINDELVVSEFHICLCFVM
jgi:hypothetical protein